MRGDKEYEYLINAYLVGLKFLIKRQTPTNSNNSITITVTVNIATRVTTSVVELFSMTLSAIVGLSDCSGVRLVTLNPDDVVMEMTVVVFADSMTVYKKNVCEKLHGTWLVKNVQIQMLYKFTNLMQITEQEQYMYKQGSHEITQYT